MDKTSSIFGNEIDRKTIRAAFKQQKKFLKKFGDDRNTEYHLAAVDHPVLTPAFGGKLLVLSENPMENLPEKPLIIGNIRMGFGHYRISMAFASVAHKMGFTPLWFDLNSFPETLCTKIISHQNDLYSLGSRLSQKFPLFNLLVWEKLNYEGFKKLTYNAKDQAVSELMTPLFNDFPKNTPYIATHVWPSQSAVHAGMTNVVNAIPDNWPMALHLSEGALHTVQTSSSYIGYKNLRGFDKKRLLKPMKDSDILYTGHYIDAEMTDNIEEDCKKRMERIESGKPVRFLLTVGGAGAQGEFFAKIIKALISYIKENKASLYVNVGDYKGVWEKFLSSIPELNDFIKKGRLTEHFDNWDDTKSFAEKELNSDKNCGEIHAFWHKDIFSAVYATNLLIRCSDVLVTKPSELAFYPVPKLHIRRVGGHEMWGAIHSSEVGDGTPEIQDAEEAGLMAVRFITDKNLLSSMCNSIIKNKNQGLYSGCNVILERF
ncbi:MAG: hypothetical protein MJ176_03975 [Treponema sp.]|nr:hypothetical protein [Treponema sp.]